MYITPGVHHKESCVKITECISQQEFIIRKVVLKVTECISQQEIIIRKVALKLRNVYHIRRSS